MSLPREVLPERTYMVTRRCTQRQFLMRPDWETNNAFVYCLAVAAERTGVEVLFTIATSNHHHTGIYDPAGTYPEFLEYFHKLFAKCQNALRGRRENFWSSEQTSVVPLTDADAILTRFIYALTNPVKDHLVERAHEWPGVTSLDQKRLSATRPRHFFREDGDMPRNVTLELTRPPGLSHLSDEDLSTFVDENIRRVEQAAAEHRRRTGRLVLGREAILRQDWRASPADVDQSPATSPLERRTSWSRIERVLRGRAFRDAYARARQGVLSGARDVVFPAGTYWLRRFAKVPCEDIPASTS
jgi:putative transposase